MQFHVMACLLFDMRELKQGILNTTRHSRTWLPFSDTCNYRSPTQATRMVCDGLWIIHVVTLQEKEVIARKRCRSLHGD
jgi:hypothetical protein